MKSLIHKHIGNILAMRKKAVLSLAILASGLAAAQESQPKLEAYGQLVKATYYHDNGTLSQQGFFKDGKLEGQWVSFDRNGNKIAMAEYSEGQKTGKWVFLADQQLTEVNYRDSRVASVKNWKREALANRN
jgi:hypothetical protein